MKRVDTIHLAADNVFDPRQNLGTDKGQNRVTEDQVAQSAQTNTLAIQSLVPIL